ncbi:MAG: CAP domain-containing protein [Pseudomonadota bacterium]
MSTASDLERLMLDLINDERTSRGLDPLQLELRLNESSEDHTEWMFRTGTFSHTGSGGSSAGDRMRDSGFEFSGSWTWGENIAWQSERGASGEADDVAQLHQGLMNSPGHRANILNPNFEVIGIGIDRATFNGWDAVMVTQNFARTGAPVQLDDGDPEPLPPVATNTAPVVDADTLTMQAGKWVSLASVVSYADADGDPAKKFRLRDVSESFDVRIAGEIQDPERIYIFSAKDLNKVSIRTDDAGVKEILALRAGDGKNLGKWDAFHAISEPSGEAPIVAVDNVEIATRSSGDRVSLADRLTVLDGQNDDILWYEIRDTQGADNFAFANGPRFDTGNKYRVQSDEIRDIEIVGNATPGTTKVAVRAFDGDTYSTWENFKIHTLVEDDPLLFA